MKTCTQPDCGRKHHAKGLCSSHYTQAKLGKPLTALRPMRLPHPRRPASEVLRRDELGRKLCVHCRGWVDEAEFHVTRANPDGLSRQCRPCSSVLARKGGLRRRYGLTVEQHRALLESQGGRCAICQEAEPVEATWHVDHDHSCCPGGDTCGNCIRGLLCPPCNRGIGSLSDDPVRLLQAAIYLLAGREAVLKAMNV